MPTCSTFDGTYICLEYQSATKTYCVCVCMCACMRSLMQHPPVMQQKVCSGGSLSFHDGARSPFFRSLDARAACPHEYHDGFSITGKLPAGPPHNADRPAARGVRRSLSDGRDAAHFLISRRRTRSVGTRQDGDQDEERDDEEDGTSDKSPDHHSGFHLGPAPLLGETIKYLFVLLYCFLFASSKTPFHSARMIQDPLPNTHDIKDSVVHCSGHRQGHVLPTYFFSTTHDMNQS